MESLRGPLARVVFFGWRRFGSAAAGYALARDLSVRFVGDRRESAVCATNESEGGKPTSVFDCFLFLAMAFTMMRLSGVETEARAVASKKKRSERSLERRQPPIAVPKNRIRGDSRPRQS